jgi:hypothetical protein
VINAVLHNEPRIIAADIRAFRRRYRREMSDD